MNPQGQIESNYDETVDNFDSMDLKPELLRGEFLVFTVRSQSKDICADIFIPGIYAYGWGNRDPLNKAIILTITQFRTSLCYPAACYSACYQQYVPLFCPTILPCIATAATFFFCARTKMLQHSNPNMIL